MMDLLSCSTSSSSSSYSSSNRSRSSCSDNSDSVSSDGGDNSDSSSDSISSDGGGGKIDASNTKKNPSINTKYRGRIIAEQMDVDLVHDRASIIEEEDRISNLPNDIIHRILSFIDMRYAIQTSALSKKWKHIWTSMPNLNLNSRTFRTLPRFTKFMNDALSHRNHCTEVSAVELSFTGGATEFAAVVTSIVNYAYSRNVKKLSLVWFRFNNEVVKFPQRLFRSHTLKHLTLATQYFGKPGLSVSKSVWDFPVLEILNLSNMQFGDSGDKSLNLFCKCVKLKDLTLHQCSMDYLDIFYVCAPQLSNLTVTNTKKFPKVFNVVVPQLESLTASVMDNYSNFLQLSIEDLDSLEKVNLSMESPLYEIERYAPGLQDLFQKVCSAKFLILDEGIIEVLSACLDQLSREPCPFNNLKCLKQKEGTQRIPTKVRNYLLESSQSATFIMDLPQVPWKRSREEVDKGNMAKKVSKVPHKRSRKEVDHSTMANTLEEEEKQQTETVDEEKRTLEAKIFRQDEVIAEQKVMLESMKLQHEKRMLEAKIEMQDKIIAQQKAMLEATKLEEKMQMQDKVIAEQKVMLETMKLQNEKRMFEAKILRQDKIIAQQKATMEGMKLQHEKIQTEPGNIDG